MGLANRLAEPGEALAGALELARQIAAFPQQCLRSDRLSAYEQWHLSWDDATRNEYHRGMEVIESGETRQGAIQFSNGAGRHGSTIS